MFSPPVCFQQHPYGCSLYDPFTGLPGGPSVMAWSHSSHLVHNLHKNLEAPHVHSHTILTPPGSGCNSLHILHNSVLCVYHHLHSLRRFLVQVLEVKVFSGCLLSELLLLGTSHSGWGWHSLSHSGTSGNGAFHWGPTNQSPSRWFNTMTSGKRWRRRGSSLSSH